ncbi:MAG: PilZ domain-containing protein [Desulfobacterales bacterium]|jgi:hypothetical protein|nr:PilZ domain-containing protein [Desulfobacterales bacterium]
MSMPNKRISGRLDSLNLSYILLNEADQIIHQGMGRTLNLSAKGAFLETSFNIASNHIVVLSIGLADELIDIRGKVAHSRPLEKGMFGTGIEFIDVSDTELEALKRFLETHTHHFIEP